MEYRMRLAVMALAALLAACGDGSGPRTSAVRVVGDSLNDSGTFGFKFTVQDALDGTRIWTDHVADAVGVDAPCARHAALGEFSLIENPAAVDCLSYAVGKGRINVPDADAKLGGDATPFSIPHQLDRMSRAKAFGPDELLLADGGGNDVADLLRAYLNAGMDGGVSFAQLLAELPMPDPMPQTPFDADAGAVYMTALADKLADDIRNLALMQGARRVVVLNIPQLTKTPYLKAMVPVLEGMSGGGDVGRAAASQVMDRVDLWIRAFNDRLQWRFATEGRVAVVDLHNPFRLWVDRPTDFGFTDSSHVACPPETGVLDSLGLPVYVLGNCQAWRLSAYPPVGAAGTNWWTTYVFADDFHGSPMTNRLMADLVLHELRERGWL